MDKPYCSACDKNQSPIYEAIEEYLTGTVLEIGSGTGQHAVYFTRKKQTLIWQTSDLTCKHKGIQQWINDAQQPNLLSPIELDVFEPVNLPSYDVVYTSNTFHIMSEQGVYRCIELMENVLKQGGAAIVYGPFFIDEIPTAQSNFAFDKKLKNQDPEMGIRNYGFIKQKFENSHFKLMKMLPMPANNYVIVFQKC